MKKRILYFILLLVVGLLVAYVVRYKTGPCICETIPQNADAAVLIKVRNLEKHYLHDMISHPMAYLGSDRKSVNDSIPKPSKETQKGDTETNLMELIDIPKSILCYRTSKENNTWYSSEMNVKNVSKLEQHLSHNDLIPSENDGEKIYTFENKYVILNDGKVRLAYSSLQSDITGSVDTELGYLSKGHPIFDALNNSTSDATYTDADGQNLSLDFESGSININGQYQLSALGSSTKETTTNGIGGLSARLDVAKSLALLSNDQKNKFSNFTKLNLDSLKQNWDGSINATFQEFTLSIDTIKTYDYDDDFNKIEIKKIDQTIAPNYNIRLGMSEEGVFYMKRKNAIVEQDGADILAIMPLAKTYCRSDNDGLYLSTSNTDMTDSKVSDSKMKLALNIKKYLASSGGDFSYVNKYLKGINAVDLNVSNDDQVNGKVMFDGSRNGLISLVSALKAK